jgi:hypothetical protein
VYNGSDDALWKRRLPGKDTDDAIATAAAPSTSASRF